MAGVAPAALIEQIRTVAWLRWRTLRNGLRNKNRKLDLLGFVLSSIFSVLFVAGVAIALFWATKSFFQNHHENYFGLLFLALLVWWQLFPILVAGFAPQFAFKTLLRFPLGFPAFYIIGIAYGFADAAALAAMVWMATMVAATLLAQATAAPLMLLMCILFAAFNVSMERLSGAWVEKLLAKRRTRELFFTMFILSMVSLNFLNPVMQKYGKTIVPAIRNALPYLWILPSSFAGDAIAQFAAHQWLGTARKLAGLCLYLALVSLLLWQRYAKLYSGEELSETAAPAREKRRNGSRATADTDFLWFLPSQVVAIFRKELLYLRRNSFLFFGLIIPPMLILFFTVQFAGAHPTALKQGVPADLFFPGMMAYLVLILIAPTYNSFAYEGRGIQTYFTSPVEFRSVLLAKNLVTVILLSVEVILCTALVGWRVGLPKLPVLAATLMACAFSIGGQLTLANWTAISYPKKIQFGKMQGQRNSGMAVLVVFVAQILFSGISATILFSGRWTGNAWLPAEIFAVLAAAVIGGYVSSLDRFTELAENKKETLIDALCR
jgi:ABC-2 type transport system permease protein